jgi:hypothetical protein
MTSVAILDRYTPSQTSHHTTPGQAVAEFYERRGRRVFEGAGSYWASIDVGSRSYLNCTEHLTLDVHPAEVSAALARHNGVAAQFASNHPGAPSGVFLVDDPNYDFEHVQKRTRGLVRSGLKRFRVEPVQRRHLIEYGLDINRETMERHDTFRDEFADPKLWRRNIDAIYAMPQGWCYGAFSDQGLEAYSFGVVDDGVLFVMVQKSRNEARDLHANHALVYASIQAAFRTGKVRAISYGTQPFLNSPHLHNFKLRMGFTLRPYNLRIALHSALEFATPKPLVQYLAHRQDWLPRAHRPARLLSLGRGYEQPLPTPITEEDSDERTDNR